MTCPQEQGHYAADAFHGPPTLFAGMRSCVWKVMTAPTFSRWSLADIGTFLPVAAPNANVQLRRYRSFVEPRQPSLGCPDRWTFATVRPQKANDSKLPLNFSRRVWHYDTITIGRWATPVRPAPLPS